VIENKSTPEGRKILEEENAGLINWSKRQKI